MHFTKLALGIILLLCFPVQAVEPQAAIPSEKKIADLSVVEKIQTYEKILKFGDLWTELDRMGRSTDKLIYQDHEQYTNTLNWLGYSYDDFQDLKRTYEVYQQIKLEMDMEKIISDPKPEAKVTFTFKYEVGYTFQMLDNGGKLEDYKILKRQDVFEKPIYLVETPEKEEIIMQESQITNWQNKE